MNSAPYVFDVDYVAKTDLGYQSPFSRKNCTKEMCRCAFMEKTYAERSISLSIPSTVGSIDLNVKDIGQVR